MTLLALACMCKLRGWAEVFVLGDRLKLQGLLTFVSLDGQRMR